MACVPLDTYIEEVIAASDFHLSLIRGGRAPLTFPLVYPDPGGAFYGYDFRSSPQHDMATMRLFVSIVCWAATVIVAVRTGHDAASKSEAVRLYREHIGDAWARFVSDVYATCKEAWGYLIPDDGEQRRHLRDLCGRALEFENHHLSVCRDYLLSQLHSAESDAAQRGVRILQRLTYLDADVQQGCAAPQPQPRQPRGAPQQSSQHAHSGHAS